MNISNNEQGRRLMLTLRLAALAAAVGCIVYGAARGEAAMVLQKAVRVCLECIGIG